MNTTTYPPPFETTYPPQTSAPPQTNEEEKKGIIDTFLDTFDINKMSSNLKIYLVICIIVYLFVFIKLLNKSNTGMKFVVLVLLIILSYYIYINYFINIRLPYVT